MTVISPATLFRRKLRAFYALTICVTTLCNNPRPNPDSKLFANVSRLGQHKKRVVFPGRKMPSTRWQVKLSTWRCTKEIVTGVREDRSVQEQVMTFLLLFFPHAIQKWCRGGGLYGHYDVAMRVALGRCVSREYIRIHRRKLLSSSLLPEETLSTIVPSFF